MLLRPPVMAGLVLAIRGLPFGPAQQRRGWARPVPQLTAASVGAAKAPASDQVGGGVESANGPA